MPEGSCSSNELNGCVACAPGLSLFSIAASANRQEDECPTFLSSTINKSYSSNGSQISDGGGRIDTGQGGTNYSSITEIIGDEQGNTTTITQINGSSSFTGSVEFIGAEKQTESANSSINGTITTITDPCGEIISFTDTTFAKSTYYTANGQVVIGEVFSDYVGDVNCYGSSDFCEASCNPQETCDKSSLESNISCNGTFGGTKFNSSGNRKFKIIYSNPIYSEETAERIVSEQLSKLTENTFTCNPGCCLKCGNGKKDDCWGGFGSFTFADPTVTISKAKLKIGIIKEVFDKTYKSVSGTVKFYIPSEEDIEEGRTPCCNDDFSGTTVKNVGFSLGGSDFKEDQDGKAIYLATDIGELSTGPVGETVVPCISITSVSFI